MHLLEYMAYETDPNPIKVAIKNYPDIIQCGDAFNVRKDDWNWKKAIDLI